MARSKVGKALTKSRVKTHGPFDEVANASWEMMRTMASLSNWTKMTDTQRMAVQEVVHKLARIGCGDHLHEDHWNDIAGYGELGARTCVAFPEKVKKTRKAKPAAKKVAKKPVKKAAKRITVTAKSRRSGQDLRDTFPPTTTQPRQRRRNRNAEEAPAQTAAE